jgi:hypothetical protein
MHFIEVADVRAVEQKVGATNSNWSVRGCR